MVLDFDTIKAVSCGAVRVSQEPEGVLFNRFTQEQSDLYEEKQQGFFYKSQASAGIKLCFHTNSRSLFIKALVKNVRSRTYFSFDVFVNDTPVGYLDNYSGLELPQDYSQISFPVGEFSRTFDLGDGEKIITVHLPWNKKTYLQEVALDDGAMVEPVKPVKKLLAFGDSITQGFDAMRPSCRYIAQLAKALNAEEFNKGIGGEGYCPELPALKDSFDPDYIVVAYGSNDWRSKKKTDFEENVKAFYAALDKNYPGVKTFVITPIWRSNLDIQTDFASFDEIESGIRQAVGSRENITVIRGFDLVPHCIDYFGDYGLHPNNKGFEHYFKNLWEQVKKYI